MAKSSYDGVLESVFDFVFSHNSRPGQGLKPRKPVNVTGKEVSDGFIEVMQRPWVYASEGTFRTFNNTI